MGNSTRKKISDFSEAELPETLFIRDVDDRVFQMIVLQCIEEIEGVRISRRKKIRAFFSGGLTSTAGISIQQDEQNQSIAIRLEVSIDYGVPIPEKSEEVQKKVSELVTHMTGLHVSSVHVLFVNSVKPVVCK